MSSIQDGASAAAAPQPALAFCPLTDPAAREEDAWWSKRLEASVGARGFLAGRNLLAVGDLTRDEIDRLLRVADVMAEVIAKQGSVDLAKGCILAALFYEPSTRTSASFQTAMLRLGGQVVSISDVANSSVAKGETLEDTVRCLQCYCNVIAMRHPETGAALRASKVLDVPLINAGDGVGEHPTQALLDLYTIHGELGRIDGLTVTMVGDLKNGRTVHSLSKILTHYKCKLQFVSPAALRMPESVLAQLQEKGISHSQHETLDEVLRSTDILYVTRVQKERFASLAEYESVKDAFVITPALLNRFGAPDSMRILHPLPRVNELAAELDSDPRAAYFRQMKHGLHVRMALLASVLGRV